MQRALVLCLLADCYKHLQQHAMMPINANLHLKRIDVCAVQLTKPETSWRLSFMSPLSAPSIKPLSKHYMP